jgi:hypothetical protein
VSRVSRENDALRRRLHHVRQLGIVVAIGCFVLGLLLGLAI